MGKMRATIRGYNFFEVSSAMQKAIRRGDTRIAGYFAVELFESGFHAYVWKRLLVISAEDCFGVITQEVESLFRAHEHVNKGRDGRMTRVFLGKAVVLLCEAKKSRDADHLTNLIYDRRGIGDEEAVRVLEEARAEIGVPVPDYAFDVHTGRGRVAGKTKDDFFVEEFDALTPREAGVLDPELEEIRRRRMERRGGSMSGGRRAGGVAQKSLF